MKAVSLVTGASGFIGTALCTKLEQLGHTVVKFNHGDYIWDIPKSNPDYIFHLAAFGNHFNQKDEEETFETNLGLTFELMEITKNLHYKAFLNFSTSGHVLECDSFYGATKAGSEYLARAFAKKYNKPIVNIRPYSVYGPGEAEFRFIPTVIKKGLKGEEIEVSEGVHDWIYIDDFIEGVIRVMNNAEKLQGQYIDIGTGEQWSNEEVIDILQAFLPKLNIKHQEKRRGYDTLGEWKADSRKLARLGIFHTHNLIDGLRKTYEYYK